LIYVFLPETLRTIAGNGSIKLSGIHKPLIYSIDQKSEPEPEKDTSQKLDIRSSFSFRDIILPFKFLREKDVFVTLLFGAIVYTIFSMVAASTTVSLKKIYGFNDVLVGISFLPNGM